MRVGGGHLGEPDLDRHAGILEMVSKLPFVGQRRVILQVLIKPVFEHLTKKNTERTLLTSNNNITATLPSLPSTTRQHPLTKRLTTHPTGLSHFE